MKIYLIIIFTVLPAQHQHVFSVIYQHTGKRVSLYNKRRYSAKKNRRKCLNDVYASNKVEYYKALKISIKYHKRCLTKYKFKGEHTKFVPKDKENYHMLNLQKKSSERTLYIY